MTTLQKQQYWAALDIHPCGSASARMNCSLSRPAWSQQGAQDDATEPRWDKTFGCDSILDLAHSPIP
jgi:hypothetical protein